MSAWTGPQRWVVGVIALVSAAVAMAQLNGDDSIASALVYIGFVLGMAGLVLGAAALFRASGRQQVAPGLGTAQKVMLVGGVVVLAWAAVSTARMDGGFVVAAFVATAAIGLVYVGIVGLGAMAISRARSR